MNAAEQAAADAAAQRAADREAGDKAHEESVAEGKDRDELRALAEPLAALAAREDKAAVVEEILHALHRPF